MPFCLKYYTDEIKRNSIPSSESVHEASSLQLCFQSQTVKIYLKNFTGFIIYERITPLCSADIAAMPYTII